MYRPKEKVAMLHQKKRLKIAYLNYENPNDKRSYSGSLYYMGRALEKHCGDVYYLDRVLPFEKRYVGRLLHEASKRLFKKNVAYDRLIFVAKKNAKIVAQRLAGQSFDVIVAPDGIPEIAFLKTAIPIVLPLDVTFSLQQGYYPHYSNLTRWSERQANTVEHMAYQKATRLLFSSDWAAQSALEDYAVEQEKIHVHAFGANLDNIPSKESFLAKKKSGQCRLLFMGIGWERKGGEIAFETLLKLEQMGISAELIVCGSTPPKGIVHERMTVIPYLNKNDEKQSKEIEKLYAMADFLLLPTRADCAPNVFKEANAFGLPVITTRTGGVPYIVRDGENGYVLPYTAAGSEYAQIIANIYQNDQHYAQLVQSSRVAYDERLNWDAWSIFVKKILEEMLTT
jgi:glycosyltransferase involved in cell wall biosynthesis